MTKEGLEDAIFKGHLENIQKQGRPILLGKLSTWSSQRIAKEKPSSKQWVPFVLLE